MPTAKRILCVVDTEAATHPVLRRGAWLAKHTGAALQLFGINYNDYLVSHPLFDEKLVQQARKTSVRDTRQRLERLAAPLRDVGLDVETVAAWDYPVHDAIVRHACRSNADFVLKDTHHHTVFDLVSLSNTDWNLIRSCPMPLWLVKKRKLPRKLRLVAAIDPMHEHDKGAALDECILGATDFVAEAVSGEVHAFHCYDPRLTFSIETLYAYPPSSARGKAKKRKIEQLHERRFREVVKPYGILPDCAHLATGFVHEELPRLAKSLDAAVVVMGAVNRNPVKRLFIGSSAERTLDRLPCDLLIVKPASFETPVKLDAADQY